MVCLGMGYLFFKDGNKLCLGAKAKIGRFVFHKGWAYKSDTPSREEQTMSQIPHKGERPPTCCPREPTDSCINLSFTCIYGDAVIVKGSNSQNRRKDRGHPQEYRLPSIQTLSHLPATCKGLGRGQGVMGHGDYGRCGFRPNFFIHQPCSLGLISSCLRLNHTLQKDGNNTHYTEFSGIAL